MFTLHPLPHTLISDITSGSTTTVAVGPKASNYQLSLSQSVGPGPISQGTDILYTITYGALDSSAFTTDDTITANFSQNTLDGVTTVADYVPGSATNAYGGAEPVVDYINKTITWKISQMPPGTTDQIVTFKLKTNSNYTGTTQVPIIVTAEFSNQFVTMPLQSVNTNYGFHISPPSPSSVTPTPTPTPAPSVTPTPVNSLITNITFTKITPTETTIHIDTSDKTRLTALYGLTPNTLFQLNTDLNLASSHDLYLSKLSPQTRYYLKVVATDDNGNNFNSDILTFITATSPSAIQIDQQSVVLIGNNDKLISVNPLLPFAQVIIPHSQPYTIALRVTPQENIQTIATLVENSQVLADNTFSSSDLSVWSAPMVEQNGTYVAHLIAPSTPSMYDLFAQIRDTKGNILQSKIAEVIVYGSLHVLDKESHQGIEHARIYISTFDTSKKSYEPIYSSQQQENPIFTDKDGFATLMTGGGQYKMSVSQYGYKSQTVTFSIDKTHIFPPTITLTHNGFNLLDIAQYYWNTASDFSQSITASLQSVSTAPRFFKLISIIVIFSLVLVTFLLFLIRTKLGIFVIPLFIKHHTLKAGTVHGQIMDNVSHQPLPLATVVVVSKATQEVMATTISNNKGVFYLDSSWINSDNILQILAQGYNPNEFAINSDLFPAVIYLHHNSIGGPLHNPLITNIFDFAGMLFETLLVLSFIFEIFFIPTIGILGGFFALLSFTNLLLYFFYQKEKNI